MSRAAAQVANVYGVGVAAYWEEVYRILNKLRALVEVCLMGEIGFDSEKTNETISRTR